VSSSAEVRPAGLYAVYASGFFSLSLVPMTSLAVPLWAVSLGAPPAMIGIAIAARSVLPFFLSIHGGVMMDRLGTRQVTLFFTLTGALFSLLYPLLPWIGAVIVLQLFIGLAQGMGWIGAQTKIARLARGSPVYAGRFSFFTTLGTFIGPMLVGKAWDTLGAWGAFTAIALWGGGLFLAAFALPAPSAIGRSRRRLHVRDFIPRLSDYFQAFALLGSASIALVVIATFMRIAAFSVQGSFYAVYLHGIGLSGAAIGVLVGFASLLGGPAALLVGPALKRVRADWLLLASNAVAIVFICVTPLLHDFILLLIAAGLFGLGYGIALPLLLSILSEATGVKEQGMSVGLRTTANRLASIVIPLAMGFIGEWAGIDNAFLIVGTLLLILGAVAVVLIRYPALSHHARAHGAGNRD